jgi:GNAT superfamily N-acetyltransferase
MRIERFDPEADPGRVRACHEAYLAGAPIDEPYCPPMSLPAFTGWLACGWTADTPEVWFAGDSPDQADGWYMAELPQRENQHLSCIHPLVNPARRRTGVGTLLLRHAAAQAARVGRTTLLSETRDGSPGEAFARSLAARPGVTEVLRLLDLTAIPAAKLAELRAESRAAACGYSELSWEGTVPEEHLGQVAAVHAAMADAPHEEDVQEQSWDADRLRAGQRLTEMQQLRQYTVAARCARSGEIAGLTMLAVDPEFPDWGFQQLTAVARPHRGHRLGLLLKVAMLDLLADREPQLRRVITGNADGNSHMIAINEALGFRFLDRQTSWQLDVADVLAVPGQS